MTINRHNLGHFDAFVPFSSDVCTCNAFPGCPTRKTAERANYTCSLTPYPRRGFRVFASLDTYPSVRPARPSPGLSLPLLRHRPSQLGYEHIPVCARMRQMPPNQVVSMQLLPGALSAVAISGAGMGEACGLLQCSSRSLPSHHVGQ